MKFITLITESKDYSKKALAIYKSFGPVYFLPKIISGLPMPQILSSISGYRKSKILNVFSRVNILVVGLKYQIDKKWIDAMPNLKIIASPATGYNHLDIEYARKRGIKIISLRGRTSFLKNIPSTAEETMALIFALARNIPASFDDVKKGNWDRLHWRGHQLLHKTIGLLGFGRLGKLVAKYFKPLGMKVIAYDPYVSKNTMKKMGVEKVKMDDLFRNSDIVSLHVLLNEDVYNLVKAKHFKIMKPSAYLINTARGELIEKGALEKALKNKWIAGAALDVMWDERGDGGHLKNNSLVEYAKKNNNLIIVPHIGGATFEAMETTQDFVADLVERTLNKR